MASSIHFDKSAFLGAWKSRVILFVYVCLSEHADEELLFLWHVLYSDQQKCYPNVSLVTDVDIWCNLFPRRPNIKRIFCFNVASNKIDIFHIFNVTSYGCT